MPAKQVGPADFETDSAVEFEFVRPIHVQKATAKLVGGEQQGPGEASTLITEF